MANPTGEGGWKPGQSGNPKGRPKKNRALTEILARAGSKTAEDCDGKRRSGKRIVARLLWQAATTGVVQFPDSKETMALSLSDWLGIVKFLYGHIDGPPKQALIDMKIDGEAIVFQVGSAIDLEKDI